MDTKKLVKILKQTPIGKTLLDEELERLALIGAVKEVVTGSELFVEGATSDSLFILLVGEVEILKLTTSGELKSLATGRSGSVLGEVGLLSQVPHAVTVRATTSCLLYMLERDVFEQLLATGDSAGVKLAVSIGKDLGVKWQKLTHEVVQFLDEQDSIQTLIASFQTSSSVAELERLRSDIWQRSQLLKARQLKLQQQLYAPNSQKEPTKKGRRKAEISLALATGMAATLMILYFLGGFQTIFSLISRSKPILIPSLTTEELCDETQVSDSNRNCRETDQ